MANRTFIDKQYTLVKRQIELYAAIATGTAGAGSVVLQKWNYPTLGAGPNARTYTAAPGANALPAGNPYPLQYAAGAEGIRSVTRTGVGAWTLKLQDNYQRVLSVRYTEESATGITVQHLGISLATTSMNAVGGSEIGLVFSNAGAPSDPPDNEVHLISLILQDATEP